ncbi:hypothetical protein SARC_08964 [Sphaeroforma arctica JP610]|uniref:Tyrosine specific protein phosphatases domain-containing protein n=1 Tax=Sphaeroforma arctica JP610 TaxID=667725 RepID=A0A0L0FRM9_9EUKA|nr:hypothetical protein SARC_08964 [Sphaeroforma arctica JP610]KNC78618.1 hypothetical protein SARC_08964 [Sphaeroforma arctica JP610]|eukprot:XP_014152520.1 hypothetical protein SARC_08964 [Sphaeroforma arctica JP610]
MRRRESASKLVNSVSKKIMHTFGVKDDDSHQKRPSSTHIVAPDDPRRNLSTFDALHNFRDLGGLVTEEGYVVKRGLLYRMARPDHMSEADIKKITDHYNIKTIIDLRRQVEIDRSKADNLVVAKFTESIKHAQRIRISGFLQTEEYEIKLRRFHVNLLGSYYLANKIYNVSSKREMIHHGLRDMFGKGPGRTAERFVSSTLMAEIGIVGNYNDMLARCTSQIGVVLKIIATEGNKSVVFHCSHGKDRTGLIAMLVLAVLGVSDADIAKDYAMSTLGLEGMQDVVQTEICSESGLPEEFSGAAEANMLATMTHLRTNYKSVSHYLEKCSFGNAWQIKLRALYLDKGTQDGIKAASLTDLDHTEVQKGAAMGIATHESVSHGIVPSTKALSITGVGRNAVDSDGPIS